MNEEQADDETAALLRDGRPLPRAAFRGSLRRRVLAMSAAGVGRPPRLRILITAYAGSGFGLLAVALFGALGAGPLAAG